VVAGSQTMSTAVHRSQNKLWRSNSIFNLWDTHKVNAKTDQDSNFVNNSDSDPGFRSPENLLSVKRPFSMIFKIDYIFSKIRVQFQHMVPNPDLAITRIHPQLWSRLSSYPVFRLYDLAFITRKKFRVRCTGNGRIFSPLKKIRRMLKVSFSFSFQHTAKSITSCIRAVTVPYQSSRNTDRRTTLESE
jgi:hypothetical protein